MDDLLGIKGKADVKENYITIKSSQLNYFFFTELAFTKLSSQNIQCKKKLSCTNSFALWIVIKMGHKPLYDYFDPVCQINDAHFQQKST